MSKMEFTEWVKYQECVNEAAEYIYNRENVPEEVIERAIGKSPVLPFDDGLDIGDEYLLYQESKQTYQKMRKQFEQDSLMYLNGGRKERD